MGTVSYNRLSSVKNFMKADWTIFKTWSINDKYSYQRELLVEYKLKYFTAHIRAKIKIHKRQLIFYICAPLTK